MSNWLVVGAGFSGAIAARRLAERGHHCVVAESRDHIGGNAYDPVHESGLRYHRYGPHAFHTNSSLVFDYLTQFTEWIKYEHRVLGQVDGHEIPIPFNLTSLDILLPSLSEKLNQKLMRQFGENVSVPIMKLRQSESSSVRMLAEFIYENIFLGYTRKQWGMEPEELGPSVMARVPVRISRDDRYFEDRFQFIPKYGYSELFRALLDHPLIEIELERKVTYKDIRAAEKVIYTGSLDELQHFTLGPLAYRSLDFRVEIVEREYSLRTAQLNFPGLDERTRVSEFKWMTGERGPKSILSHEYPRAHVAGETEPYYPMPTEQWRSIHNKYREELTDSFPNVVAFGRLADYRYFNMDQAVARALQVMNDLQKEGLV